MKLPVLVECKPFNARLTEASCARRYALASSKVYVVSGNATISTAASFMGGHYLCADCSVGKERAEAVNPDITTTKSTLVKKRNKSPAFVYRGVPRKEWAKRYGVTEDAIRVRVKKHGWRGAILALKSKYGVRYPGNYRMAAERARCIRRRAERGESDQDIASLFNLKVRVVQDIRRGVRWKGVTDNQTVYEAQRCKYDDAEIKRVMLAIDYGMTRADAAEFAGVTYDMVCKVARGAAYKHLTQPWLAKKEQEKSW